MSKPRQAGCVRGPLCCGARLRSVSRLVFVLLVVSCPLRGAPVLASLELQKGPISGDLGGSLELSAPVRFDPQSRAEMPSFRLLLKSDLRAGEHAGFYGEIRAGYDGSQRSARNEGFLLGWKEVYPSKDRYAEVAEAYVSLFLPDLDLRIGVQKFAWGTLDQINPTDNLSPLDLRHLLTSEALERKIGVPALRALYGSVATSIQIEAVWIPFLVPYRFPDRGDRWYPPVFQAPELVSVILPGLPEPIPLKIEQTNEEPDLPARNIRHSELGIRLARTLGNVDLGLSYFNGYDRRPVIRADGVVVTDLRILPPEADFNYLLTVRPDFHRIQVFGFDAAASRGLFTFRAEGAYIKDRFINMGLKGLDKLIEEFRFPPLSALTLAPLPGGIQVRFPYSPQISFRKNVLSVGGGVDYQWGDHLLSLQVMGDRILNDHGEDLIYRETEIFVTVGTHSRFLEDTLQLEGGLLHNPMEELWIGSVKTTYSITDALAAGFDLLVLDGKSTSPFGQFSHNDQIVLFARYSF
ncbi:MAG: DUF1302 family protein [bacterium]